MTHSDSCEGLLNGIIEDKVKKNAWSFLAKDWLGYVAVVTNGIAVLNIPISFHLYSDSPILQEIRSWSGDLLWSRRWQQTWQGVCKCPLSLGTLAVLENNPGSLLRPKPLGGRAERCQQRPLRLSSPARPGASWLQIPSLSSRALF